jgi:hypothetical protein
MSQPAKFKCRANDKYLEMFDTPHILNKMATKINML